MKKYTLIEQNVSGVNVDPEQRIITSVRVHDEEGPKFAVGLMLNHLTTGEDYTQ